MLILSHFQKLVILFCVQDTQHLFLEAFKNIGRRPQPYGRKPTRREPERKQLWPIMALSKYLWYFNNDLIMNFLLRSWEG